MSLRAMRMSRLLELILCASTLLFLANDLHATCDSPFGGFVGSIDDKYSIALVMNEGYAYNTSDHVIPIKSEIITVGQVSKVRITELDEKGMPAAVFEGTFQDVDPRGHFSAGANLRCEVITGKWKSLKDGRSMPFYLIESGWPMGSYRVDDNAKIDAAAIRFRRAVIKKDKKTVALSIRYPITVFLDGNRKHQKRIKGTKDLMTVYDRIFLPRYVKKIREDVPLLMFSNSHGIMLGDGEVWFDFDGKVIALNSVDLDNPSLLERLFPPH